ncbi:MAG: SDR family NAD(P)-dependent oxidoreductase [Pseudomonadota bacterium]|nr:SDR family NAD(P)-dependent oxidoreductase [Pseudomonadota bacterium]
MQPRFEGRVAIVTGGTSGIGLATVRRLLAEGATVVMAGRDRVRGARALAELDTDRVSYAPLDIVDREAAARVIGFAADRHGRLDLLVNAAGSAIFGKAETLAPKHWQRLIDINLTGAFQTCQLAIPHLKATVAAGHARTTAIVNVASISGTGGDHGMAAYNAAKAGLLNLSRSLALELAGAGIRVNTVSPGPVDTPMAAATAADPAIAPLYRDAIPLGRYGEPEEVAAAIAFLGAEEAGFITGANLMVDGGLSAGSGLPDLARILARRND